MSNQSIAQSLLKKFEYADAVTVRIPFSDIKHMGDMEDAKKLSSDLIKQAALFNNPVEIENVSVKLDGNKKELVLIIDIKGYVNRAKFIDEIKKLFK